MSGKRTASSSPAFTLLEVLLAITITGFVLAAATSLVVSVSNIWMNRQDSHFFEDHVDGVTEFIQSSFSEAGVEIALEGVRDSEPDDPQDGASDTDEQEDEVEDSVTDRIETGGESSGERSNGSSGQAASGLVRVVDNPIGWAKPPGFAAYRDPLLNFKLHTQPPLLVDPQNAPALGVDAFLYFKRDEGLSLLWYSLLQEEAEDERDLRRTLISPFVESILYVYWDERFERWEEEEEPREEEGGTDGFLLPRYLKLVFVYEGVRKERTLFIPVVSRTALIF